MIYLCKKLPKEGTNKLSKDGFNWIALKVVWKIQKRSHLTVLLLFCQFSQKQSDNFSLYFLYTASWGWYLINREEMDFIELFEVIFKVGKIRFGPFPHNYLSHSVVEQCCPNVLHHVASLLCPKIWKLWNHSKSHFQGQKGPISANISETVHRISFFLSVYLIKFGWHWKVKDILVGCYS